MNVAPIIRQSLDLWSNPAFSELSVESIIDAANRVLAQHNLDLDLTADACFFTGTSESFTFASADDRSVLVAIAAIDDISRIVRVDSRGVNSTSEDDWGEEVVASFEAWNEILDRGDDNFVTFQRGEEGLRMHANRDVSNSEFRIIYKALQPKIQSLAQQVELPTVYEPLLVYDLALEMGEMIDNFTPEFLKRKADKMRYLTARYTDAYDRVERWRRSQKPKGPTYRRAFNQRAVGFSLGRRRFTVNY